MRLGKRDKNSIASPSDNVDKTLEGEHTKNMLNDKDNNKPRMGDPFYNSCTEYTEQKLREFEMINKVMEQQELGAIFACYIGMLERITHLARKPSKTTQEVWELVTLVNHYQDMKNNRSVDYKIRMPGHNGINEHPKKEPSEK